jgi:hypothetical protein
VFNAIAAISFAKSTNESFLATKSVSQLRVMATALFLASLTNAIAAPSVDSRSARLAATFCPFLRRISIALSKSPSASTRAFFTVHHSSSGSFSQLIYVCSRNFAHFNFIKDGW